MVGQLQRVSSRNVESQVALYVVRRIRRLETGCVHFRHQGLNAFRQRVALVRGPDTSGGTQEKRHTELLLDPRNRAADLRRRNAQPLRRCAEAALIQHEKYLEIVRRHDLAGLAEVAGELLGRPVSRIIVSEESVKARAHAAGPHHGTVAVMLGYYRAARAGESAATDPALARILGRSPETMREFLKANL